MPTPARPLHVAFLGCGFITAVHAKVLRRLGHDEVVCSFASRNRAKAEAYRTTVGGRTAYGGYEAAIDDSAVDAIVVAVPPNQHLALALAGLAAGKHVFVEKPAFPTMDDYRTVREARDRAGRVVIVGENDHYKPLAVLLRRLLAEGTIGDLVFAHFTTITHRLKRADDWRNDERLAGGDAFFEEGIHWLHLANSLGPSITTIHGYRPAVAASASGDVRVKSMLISFRYDNGAVGSLFYSREIPSLFKGLRLSKIFGRKGVITFESNGAVLVTRSGGVPRVRFPGFRDIRGYRAMYRDFAAAIRDGRQPEMSLERAIEDHRLMDQVYATVGPAVQ